MTDSAHTLSVLTRVRRHLNAFAEMLDAEVIELNKARTLAELREDHAALTAIIREMTSFSTPPKNMPESVRVVGPEDEERRDGVPGLEKDD